jgi:hypothetical protein
MKAIEYDEYGRYYISHNLRAVDAVCHDGVVRRVFIPYGDVNNFCYAEYENGVIYYGELSLIDMIHGDEHKGPFEFTRIKDYDDLEAAEEAEYREQYGTASS